METKDNNTTSSPESSSTFEDFLKDMEYENSSQMKDEVEESDVSEFGKILNRLDDDIGVEEFKSTASNGEASDGIEITQDDSILSIQSSAVESSYSDPIYAGEHEYSEDHVDDSSRSSFTTLLQEASSRTVDMVDSEVSEKDVQPKEENFEAWGTTRDIQDMCGVVFKVNEACSLLPTELNPERKYSTINPHDELGVYAITNIRKGTALSVFAGVYKKYPRYNSKYSTTLFEYGTEVIAFPRYTDFQKYMWVLDGEGFTSPTDGIAHFINSAHPHLPPPYNTPNAQLHHEQPDENFDPDCRPPLVIAQTITDIECFTKILVDYHWLLIGVYTPMYMEGKKPLGSCGCKNCETVVKNLLIKYFI